MSEHAERIAALVAKMRPLDPAEAADLRVLMAPAMHLILGERAAAQRTVAEPRRAA